MSKKSIGAMVVVTVLFFAVELSYLNNLIAIPLLNKTSEMMWILGILSGFLLTVTCIAVLNYNGSNRKGAKKENMGTVENRTSKVVKIKR